MDIQIDGKSIAEIAPAAADFFRTSETVRHLGLAALADGVARTYIAKLQALEAALRSTAAERDDLRATNARLANEIELIRSKLSRPKAGRQSLKKGGRSRGQIPDDADETTQELMDEAYNGKKPHSKSEMRRLAVMKEKNNG